MYSNHNEMGKTICYQQATVKIKGMQTRFYGRGRSLGKGRKGEVERERERGGRWTFEVFCFQQTSSQDKGVQACD